MKRILFVAPHSDDELLGAGCSLLRWKAQGADICLVLVCCSDVTLRHAGDVLGDQRLHEFNTSAMALGTRQPKVLFFADSKTDQVPIVELVGRLDDLIAEIDPDCLLMPEPSYHQDHQWVNRGCIAALRNATDRRQVPRVLSYEVPTSVSPGSPTFRPNWYVDATPYLDRKIELFRSVYGSQHTDVERGGLAERGIVRHAQYRGTECGVDAAEAFCLIREIEA